MTHSKGSKPPTYFGGGPVILRNFGPCYQLVITERRLIGTGWVYEGALFHEEPMEGGTEVARWWGLSVSSVAMEADRWIAAHGVGGTMPEPNRREPR